VPAAAVILGGQALFIIIGRKGCVGWIFNKFLKFKYQIFNGIFIFILELGLSLWNLKCKDKI
jgi:hypothetical protein